MIGMTQSNDEQMQLMTNGMEILVGLLGSVASGIGQPKH